MGFSAFVREDAMAKQDEIDYLSKYLSKSGAAGLRFELRKPFSDRQCGPNLMQIGAVMSLLPPPPVRLHDLGRDTGWTSRFLGQRGYEVVGVDISPDMIFHAEEQRQRDQLDQVSFLVSDYESLSFDEEFDGALFFGSLHHSGDEGAAVVRVDGVMRLE